ncbi:MAG: ATP-binding protein [Aquabacterium sp.]
MSIRTRLLLIALLAVLVPALIAVAHYSEDRRSNVESDTRRLGVLAQDRVHEIHERIGATTQLHFGLARAGDLASSDRAQCSAFLAEVREAHPQYTGILTINPDGRLFCDSLRTGRELDLNDRGYFRRALAQRGGVVLEPTFGRLTGRAVMQVASPVRAPDGSLRFVLLASLDLSKLAPLDAKDVPSARLLLVDDKGTVLVATSPQAPGIAAGGSIAGTPLGQFSAQSPDTGITRLVMPDGQRFIWARADNATLANAGLRVLAGAPEAAVVAEANRHFQHELLLILLFAAGLFMALWWVAERFIRDPIAGMTQMAGRLAGGDLAARVQAPLPRGELGDLATALNHAAGALQLQREDIARLDARLMQSQRLEAIGQLTGGVAHDFNNLLTVVLGNADLLAETCVDDPAKRQAAQMIVEAAQSGAVLTQQLLAFARKQPLMPGVVDVNQRIAALDPLLRRTLGEHIEIEVVRGAGLWPALVDATQLENALLNLCLNARDAMPTGGKLTLETANASLDRRYADQYPELTPGQYTLIAVSDTGVGIAAQDLPRVFEPFFTTKAKGKGTGLGLAMVYGFAKQSGGHIGIYSEPGQGTTVKLYLPRATGPRAVAEGPPVEDVVPGAGQTLLVVEDDEAVRQLACHELRALGYRVLQAASGAQALPLLEGGETIDLLFTDVVMPGGMSGRELADAARRLRPGLRVLYTSGYTENAIVHHGRLDPGVQLLPKPYRRTELARAVRAALQREGG